MLSHPLVAVEVAFFFLQPVALILILNFGVFFAGLRVEPQQRVLSRRHRRRRSKWLQWIRPHGERRHR